jgi:hypothetical protein
MKIEARIFRFDAKNDYLGSYQPFIYHVGGSSTLGDLLCAFKQSEPLCAANLDRIAGVKANGAGAKLDAPTSAFANKNGETIVLEPLMSDRAVLDLECDTRDFENKLKVLEEFCDASDRDYYGDFFIPYAVSPMRTLNAEYLGEALFMLADRLIAKNPLNTETILRRISRSESGIFCFAGLNGVLFEGGDRVAKTIEALQEAAIARAYAPKNAKSAKYAALDVSKPPNLAGKKAAIAADCGAFAALPNVADYEAALKANGAEVLRLSNPFRFSGASLADLLPNIALKAASDLVLEAQDCGADSLICLSAEVGDFLTKNLGAIKRVGGYPIDVAIAKYN